MLAQFAVLSRLKEPENSSIYSKMRIYDGENLKDRDPKAKSLQEYKDNAGVDEGMNGLSTRFAFKVLSKVFNFDATEVAANPVHLLYVLENQIEQEQFPTGGARHLPELHQGVYRAQLRGVYRQGNPDRLPGILRRVRPEPVRPLRDLRRLLGAGPGIPRPGDRRDPQPRSSLNDELEKIEKPAGISNPKDFRSEIVNFVLRARANNEGDNPAWTSYEKLRSVIEKKMFASTEDLLPVISFNAKASAEDQQKHSGLPATHDRPRVHREAGAPAERVVPAGAEVAVAPKAG